MLLARIWTDRSWRSGTGACLDSEPNYTSWDVGLEGGVFYMIQFGGEGLELVTNEFVLVQNWIEEVRERVGG